MSIPFAPQSMEFGLGENADAIRDVTARWAADRLAPLAAEMQFRRPGLDPEAHVEEAQLPSSSSRPESYSRSMLTALPGFDGHRKASMTWSPSAS